MDPEFMTAPPISEIDGPWAWGWQWRPKIGSWKDYYDGWHYTLHLGFIWISKSYYFKKKGENNEGPTP